MMIVDTTFLIDLMQKDEGAIEKSEAIVKRGVPTIISAVSVFELQSGLARSGKSISEQNKVREALENQIIIPIDMPIAEKAGDLHGSLISHGQMLGSMDCLIAATAVLNGETLLTRNIKDFKRVPGITIETY